MSGKIVRGKLSKLEDTNHPKFAAIGDKNLLSFNAITGLWEPTALSDVFDGKIGVPTDTTYADGLLDFTEDTLIPDAVDDINEILKELAPANADTLAAVAFTGGMTKYSAKVPSGLTGDNWDGVTAGSTIANAVISLSGDIATGGASTTFNYADAGQLELYVNAVKVATIDLAANFNETNRNGNQSMSDYDNTGVGDAITNGVVSFNTSGIAGTFTMLTVGKYNNFKKWQKGTAKLAITSAPAGANTLYVKHVGISTPQQSANYTFTYDNDTSTVAFVGTPTIVEATSVTRFLSGVKYYTLTSTFNIDYTVDNLFKNLYKTSGVTTYELQDGITLKTIDPASTPVYTDQMIADVNAVAIDEANIFTGTAALKIYTYTPYASTATYTETGKERHVLTYGNVATAIAESFRDENYRLPLSFDFTSKTDAITGVYDSSVALTSGNAQCYLTGLIVPSKNFSAAAVLPAQAIDYSAFSGIQKYARAFVGTTKSGITMTLNSIVGTLGVLGTGDINVEIKLPTQSGWCDAVKPYDSGIGVANDGDGMLSGAIAGGVFSATFGGKNTVDSGNRIYVRITLRTSTAKIGSISTNW